MRKWRSEASVAREDAVRRLRYVSIYGEAKCGLNGFGREEGGTLRAIGIEDVDCAPEMPDLFPRDQAEGFGREGVGAPEEGVQVEG